MRHRSNDAKRSRQHKHDPLHMIEEPPQPVQHLSNTGRHRVGLHGRTWLAWGVRPRRFQGSGQCLLHPNCHGEDAPEHYAVCPYQWNVFQSRLKKEIRSQSISSFLGIAAAQIEDMVFHACHIYQVKRAIDIRRHAPGNARLISGQVDGLIWNGHRTAALYHNGLARRYRQLGH